MSQALRVFVTWGMIAGMVNRMAVAALCVFGLSMTDAASAASTTSTTVSVGAPIVAFVVNPDFVACKGDAPPTRVKVAWTVRNGVSSVTIDGAVNSVGARKPLTVEYNEARKVTGKRHVLVPCKGTTHVLTLTATGPGGQASAIASVVQNRV